jgi:hypothetical protein
MDLALAEFDRELQALDLFGVDAHVEDDELRVDDGTIDVVVSIVRRASVTPADAGKLVAGRSSGVVVGDLIHAQAKEVLRAGGWSYWDRRGELSLVVPEVRLRVLCETTVMAGGVDRPDPMRPVSGVGGLSVALASLLQPDDPPGVREIARGAAMAPSTISRARRHLTEANLLEPNGRPLIPELFWATSDAWSVDWWPIDTEPEADGWLLTADAAAAEWGAPTLGADRRYYGTDLAQVARLKVEHAAAPDDAACVIAAPPTPFAVLPMHGNLVAPVVAALDLSRDARGRQILGEWKEVAGYPSATLVWQ